MSNTIFPYYISLCRVRGLKKLLARLVRLIIIRVFCPRAGPPLQTQEPTLQFCRRQTQEPRLQFYQGLNRCGSFPLLSTPHTLFSIWTDLKRSSGTNGEVRRVDLANWALRTSPKFSTEVKWAIRVFDQIRDPEIPITLRLLLDSGDLEMQAMLGAMVTVWHWFHSVFMYSNNYKP